MFGGAALALPLFVMLGSACGARSQLASADAGPEDAGDAAPPTSCVHERPSQVPGPAYIELVLDGSGSMADDGKWDAAVIAVNALFDEYLSAADKDVALGLLVFADHKDATGGDGPYPNVIDVPPAFVDQTQYAALTARMAGTHPVGPTPTFEALSGAFPLIRDYVPAPPVPKNGRRVVVLVSDGAPTPVSASGGRDEEKAKTVALAKDQLATPPSILTFAIGIGPFPPPSWYDYDPEFMGELAVAGGTRLSPNCDPAAILVEDVCHLQITPDPRRTAADLAGDMLKALHDVRARTVDVCTYTLDGDFARFVPAGTHVTIDSSGNSHDIAADPENGWVYDSPTNPRAVLLKGQACDLAIQDANAKVTMSFGCTE